jgi:DNA-binding transcriptional ArsR family regulator
LESSAPVFAALGDPTRLQLVARLSSSGPTSIARLTSGMHVTRQAVTRHLEVMESAGLARGSRHGRERRWQLQPERLHSARQSLDRISEWWDDALSRLKSSLESADE